MAEQRTGAICSFQATIVHGSGQGTPFLTRPQDGDATVLLIVPSSQAHAILEAWPDLAEGPLYVALSNRPFERQGKKPL